MTRRFVVRLRAFVFFLNPSQPSIRTTQRVNVRQLAVVELEGLVRIPWS